jgi:prephenate dehydrogenase
MNQVVAIIGTGLIGGSLALNIKKYFGKNVLVKAYDVQENQLKLALSLGIIDQPTNSYEEAIDGADVIFLCTPVETLGQLLEPVMLSPRLKAGAIISDVGSTKVKIVERATRLSAQSKGKFIGGHPMAGSHKSGVEAANDLLFENAYYVLTPSQGCAPDDVEKLKEVLKATRAKIVEMTAEEHDKVVAAISHFPHVIASALVRHLHHYQQDSDWYTLLAAGGFKDITRIASSNPKVWCDIVLSNTDFIIQQMKDWQHQMDEVLHLIESRDREKIEHFFRQAKEIRDGLPETRRGAIPSFYDLYVDIPDHPGIIGQVTTLLGIHQISITNLSILETREDIMGVLRLTFRHEHDLMKAEKVLKDANFPVYRLN